MSIEFVRVNRFQLFPNNRMDYILCNRSTELSDFFSIGALRGILALHTFDAFSVRGFGSKMR